jgi:hypothetical protein
MKYILKRNHGTAFYVDIVDADITTTPIKEEATVFEDKDHAQGFLDENEEEMEDYFVVELKLKLNYN